MRFRSRLPSSPSASGVGQVELKRSISLPLLTFYGIGTILGAGIYVLVGKVAGSAGMHAPVAFLVASLLAAFSAFSYAELASRFPLSAGEAVYVQQGLGRRHLSLLVGLFIVTMGTVSCATMIHGFVGYLGVFFDLPRLPVMVAMVLVLGAVAVWGIGESVWLASAITVIELFGLLLVLWVSRGVWDDLPAHAPQLMPGWDGSAWLGVLLGAFLAFYAFIGFEDIVNVAEEVRGAPRNVPRAVLLALVTTTVLYLAVATASVLAVSPAALSASDAPLALVYERATGQAPMAIAVISLFSVINGALIQLIMGSRVLYGLSSQGWLPRILARVSPRTRTPVVATVFVMALILGFALWLPLVTLARATSFVTLIVFSLINLALWRIKRRGPAEAGVFEVPGWVPVGGFVASLGFLIFQALQAWRG